MKKKKVVSLLLALFLLSALCLPSAQAADFSDLSGHWAEKNLRQAVSDELLSGFEDGTLRPNEPITAAQMITILCRVLDAQTPKTAPAVAVSPDAWYYAEAQKACALGLISGEETDLDAPMIRQDALSMLAKAFRLIPAKPPLSAISSLPDYPDIREENRAAMAVLFSKGYINGYAGYLNVDKGITRAEFIAVLYRIASAYAKSIPADASGGTVITEGGIVSFRSFSEPLWFDCSADALSFSGFTGADVTLLSPEIDRILLNSSAIENLTLAGSLAELSVGSGSSIGTLRACGSLKAALDGSVKSAELTGSGAKLSLSGSHGALIISGSGNEVTLAENCTLESLNITGCDNTVTFLCGSGVKTVSVSGSGNSLQPSAGDKATVGENVFSDVSVSGSNNEMTLWGNVSGSVTMDGHKNLLLISSEQGIKTASVFGSDNWLTLSCGDMESVEVGGSGSTVHKCFEGSVGAISVTGSGCALRFYTGNAVKTLDIAGNGNSIVLDGSAGSVTIDGGHTAISGAGSAGSITINAPGCDVSVACAAITDNSYSKDSERVLALVSCEYEGDFTLKWAQEHDYDDYDKEVFVNVKGYESETDYLIWVNTAMQRVNIFEGSKEDWKLSYSCIVGTGAMRSQTPVGTYATTYKSSAGWTTATYTCRPVVGFYKGTGYAFHSRLYYPRSNTLTDAQIGYPVSHGCVRMYDEDVWYIYNNIPLGTTVVVF